MKCCEWKVASFALAAISIVTLGKIYELDSDFSDAKNEIESLRDEVVSLDNQLTGNMKDIEARASELDAVRKEHQFKIDSVSWWLNDRKENE